MESNRDEALKCLSIAQRHRDAGNYPAARRFCLKSKSLFSTPEASKLLANIDELETAQSDGASESSSAPFASGTEQHPSASGAKHRHGPSASTSKTKANGTASGSGGDKREYTPENAAVVKRIIAFKAHQYYEILSLTKNCEEADVKKAYRKLALQLHPDKNGAPGADEAFKMVSKAFQVLSDPQKRAAFDQHGSDPDSRFAGMSSSSSPGFAGGRFGGGGGMDGELSPEDLFNMFFGGGQMGGGAFGGPGVFSASFGPGGFRTTRVRTSGTRAPGAAQVPADTSIRNVLMQLAPLLVLFFFTFMSAMPNIFSTPPTPDPRFSFSPSHRYNMERQTNGLHVRYHVNSAEFSAHPIAADLAAVQRSNPNARPRTLDVFERTIERAYTQELYTICQREVDRKQRRKEQKSGFLGIGADWEAIRQIEAEPIESCDELRRLGVIA